MDVILTFLIIAIILGFFIWAYFEAGKDEDKFWKDLETKLDGLAPKNKSQKEDKE